MPTALSSSVKITIKELSMNDFYVNQGRDFILMVNGWNHFMQPDYCFQRGPLCAVYFCYWVSNTFDEMFPVSIQCSIIKDHSSYC